MSAPRPYPWQQAIWQGLNARIEQGRLPHALLLIGSRGMGKRDLATALAHRLLCDSPVAGIACGECRACLLLAAGSHPDYLRIEPEEEGKGIGIDRVRALATFQSLKSQYGRAKVVQLEPADRLGLNAANALLKTLEEPSSDTVLLLTTDRPMSLLPTIRSRCQQIIFRPAPSSDVISWLKSEMQCTDNIDKYIVDAAGGAPLLARQWLQQGELEWRREQLQALLSLEQGERNALSLAEKWNGEGSGRILSGFYGLLLDLLRLKLAPGVHPLTNPHLPQQLHALADGVDLGFLQSLAARVQEWSGLTQTQVNQQMLLEELLLAWIQRRVA